MANEIIVLESVGGRRSYVFLYTIAPGDLIEVGSTLTNPVHSPSSSLDEYAQAVLSAAEIVALDAGSMIALTRSYSFPSSMTNGAIQTELRALYAKYAPKVLTKYKERYEFIGVRIDKE